MVSLPKWVEIHLTLFLPLFEKYPFIFAFSNCSENANIMETSVQKNDCIITRSYEEYHMAILNYITCRITHRNEAEDLAQDVFVRLLDYKQMLRPDTVKYFLYTIARNIVTDYLRRYYKKQEITAYIYDVMSTASCNETEESILVNDLLAVERAKLATFPDQRRIIYTLSRFHNKNTAEISDWLKLSKRTVENHLLLGRKEMRTFMKKCI